ncbi:uncharacterized protein [Branchiostoma lanceolatum]|uniref:uncharacterized protein n=1 Tax=Branchiostoma lanceolatum TaxID=7740 RepID=UPI0034512F7D
MARWAALLLAVAGSLAVCRAQREFTTLWPTTLPPTTPEPEPEPEPEAEPPSTPEPEPEISGCEYNGRIYPPGTTISETTGCMGSGMYCDENGQILVSDNFGFGCCERNGQYYEHGDTFTEGGGTCFCVGSQDAEPAPLNCTVCGENSSFRACGTGDCQSTCEVPAPICPAVCIAGCQCDPGFVLQNGECIPRSQCEGGGSDIGDCRGSWSTPEGCRGDDCDHSVSWTYNSDTDKIFFEMSARQTNDKWIGIGFSNDQRMPNSDVIVAAVATDGSVSITDRWATGHSMPGEDGSNNVENPLGSYNNGVINVNFTRQRITGDDKDLAFTDDDCLYMFYALGGTYNHASQTLSIHATTPTISEQKICIRGECPTEQGSGPCRSSPCRNDGICWEPGDGGFLCRCHLGYDGPTCENYTDPCQTDSNPCMNGGTCTYDDFGDVRYPSCTCPPGFTGRVCEIPVPAVCEASACKNGGDCLTAACSSGSEDCQPEISCVCPAGFTGYYCEFVFGMCGEDSCGNGGDCQQVPFESYYSCECPDGTAGARCQSTGIIDCSEPDIFWCDNGLCVHQNRTCNDEDNCGDRSDERGCPTGACKSYPCMNGASCCDLGDDEFSCLCPLGYLGETCDSFTDPCGSVNNPCANGGTCMSMDMGDGNRPEYSCQCPPGFTGMTCEIPLPTACEENTCQNGGDCVTTACSEDSLRHCEPGISCVCPAGFTGYRCEFVLGRCEDGEMNSCSDNGECIQVPCKDYYSCECRDGTAGARCESTGIIDCSEPGVFWCDNGLCVHQNRTCNDEDNCGDRSDERGCPTGACKSYPCMNGASCCDLGDDEYSCLCPLGYHGETCDSFADPCGSVNNPCANGGTRMSMDMGDGNRPEYSCQCAPGFTGMTCEIPLPSVCDENTCQNGGRCLTAACSEGSPGDCEPGISCVCPAGFTGYRCEFVLGRCEEGERDSCSDNGECMQVPCKDYYSCECRDGFDGPRCQMGETDVAIAGCSPIEVDICREVVPYNTTKFPNLLDHQSQQAFLSDTLTYQSVSFLMASGCHPMVQFGVCSAIVPECDRELIKPCKSFCYDIRQSCEPLLEQQGVAWPSALSCDDFPDLPDKCASPYDERVAMEVRLVNGTSANEGRVEIRLGSGEWGTVCDDSFDIQDANVVCRQLGYDIASSYKESSYFGRGSGSTWLNNVDCDGDEETLLDCGSDGWGVHNCPGHYEDAGVVCLSFQCSPIEVEMCRGAVPYNITAFPNLLGHMSQREFLTDSTSLQVINGLIDSNCHPEVQFAVCSAIVPRCDGTVRIEPCRSFCIDVRANCEQSITQQGHSWPAFLSCDGLTDLPDDCSTPYDKRVSLDVRLVGGASANEGRVEIRLGSGDWGTICDDNFDIKDANVVCRQLGYGIAVEHRDQAFFGEGSGDTWLDELQCTGDEDTLLDCESNIWGEHNCGHSEDVGVVCLDCTQPGVIPCDNGKCFLESQRCNREDNCLDRTDERDCSCAQFGELECRNGGCYRPSDRCDGFNDCGDWTDEDNCPSCFSSTNTLFHCQNRRCMHLSNICNDVDDCGDGSDESPDTCLYDCEDTFQCGDGQCRPQPWKCDGSRDCQDGSDENPENCDGSCKDYHFTCDDNQCIPLGLKCDGAEDCTDGSDERNCDYLATCGTRRIQPQRTRITYGDDADEGKWPWQAQLTRTVDDSFLCGGTLVGGQFLVTAAHCVEPFNSQISSNNPWWEAYGVVLGARRSAYSPSEEGRRVPGIRHAVVHKDYESGSNENDIAVFQLKSYEDNDYINSACLPETDTEFDTNSHCFVTGWGNTENGTLADILQEARVALIPDSACLSNVSYGPRFYQAEMICAGYWDGRVDTCQGDSGGPLVCAREDNRWYLTGVTSWGDGCGIPRKPGISTRVTNYIDWIKSIMNNTYACSWEGSYMCEDTEACIPASFRCDRKIDCENGDDERDCQDARPSSLDIRLVGGSTQYEGRVEIRNSDGSGVWGTICDDNFDINAANVVCRQLGYGLAMSYQHSAHFGEGNGSIWLDDVQCVGDEDSLLDCSSNDWGENNCGHFEDVGVVCSNTTSNASLEIRLVGGATEYEGRVEVRLDNGEWGTICDDDFDLTAANVVCRQLGYGKAESYGNSAEFGQGNGSIWLDDVRCAGDEESLLDCSSNGWGENNCGHYEDVGVVCSNTTGNVSLEIRLVGGASANEGRVEIRLGNGDWGTICDDGFDIQDANVICRQLGYGSAESYHESAVFGEGTGPIWLDEVECVGDEESLLDCSSDEWNQHNCGHYEDVGVVCLVQCEPLSIEMCRNVVPYNSTMFPNLLGHVSQQSFLTDQESVNTITALMNSGCHPDVGFAVCSALVPNCVDSTQASEAYVGFPSFQRATVRRFRAGSVIATLDTEFENTGQAPSTTQRAAATLQQHIDNNGGRLGNLSVSRVDTDPPPASCEPLPSGFSYCTSFVDYNYTAFPNSFNHMSQLDIFTSADFQGFGGMLGEMLLCYPNIYQVFCPAFLPKCEDGSQVFLCRSVCEKVNTACAPRGVSLPFSCDVFPADGTQECMTLASSSCEPVPTAFEYCTSVMDYNSTGFPNVFNHTSQLAVARSDEFRDFSLMLANFSFCYPNIYQIFCPTFLPKCENGSKVFLCRSVCEEVNAACAPQGVSLPFTCDAFPADGTQECLTLDIPTCQPIPHDRCENMPYTETFIPAGVPVEALVANADALFATVDRIAGCHAKLDEFACSFSFPPCTFTGIRYPCASFCNEIVDACTDVANATGVDWDSNFCAMLPPGSYEEDCFGPLAQCEPIEVGMCRNVVPYNTTTFPNLLGHVSQQSFLTDQDSVNTITALMNSGCHPDVEFAVCSALVPNCVDSMQSWSLLT